MHARIGNSGLRRGSGSPAPTASSTPTPVALSPGWSQAKPRVGLSRPRRPTPSTSQKQPTQQTQSQLTPVEQQRGDASESKENTATVTAHVSSIAAAPVPAVPCSEPAAACLLKPLPASLSPERENRHSNSPANGMRATALLSASKSPLPPSASATAAVCASPLPTIPPSPDEEMQQEQDVSALQRTLSPAATPIDPAPDTIAAPASASASNSQPMQLSPHILATPEPAAAADPNQSIVCIPETPNMHNTSMVAAAVDSTISAATSAAAAAPSPSLLSPPTLAAAAPVPSAATSLVTPKPSRHRGGGGRRKHRVPSSLPLPLVFSPEEQTQEEEPTLTPLPLPPSMDVQLFAPEPAEPALPLQSPPLQQLTQEPAPVPAAAPVARSRRRTKVEPQLDSKPLAAAATVAPSAPDLCSSASSPCMAAPLPLLSNSLDPHDLLLSECHAQLALKHMEEFEQAEAEGGLQLHQQQEHPQMQHAEMDVKPLVFQQRSPQHQHLSPHRTPPRSSRMDDSSFVDELDRSDAPSFVAPDMMASRPLMSITSQQPLKTEHVAPASAAAVGAASIAPPIAFSLPSATPSTPPRNSQPPLSGGSPSRRFPPTDRDTRIFYHDRFRALLRDPTGAVTLDRAMMLETFIESRVRAEGRDYEPMANEILHALKRDPTLARQLCISIAVPELVARCQPGAAAAPVSPARPAVPVANGTASAAGSPEVQVIAPPLPQPPAPVQRTGKFFKKNSKAGAAASAAASAAAAAASSAVPTAAIPPSRLSGVDAEFAAGPSLPAPAPPPPPPPPPARRPHGILAYTSPTAKSAAEQLQEKDALEFARQKAKQDAEFALMAQKHREAELAKARKAEEDAAAEAEHLALIRANKAVAAGHSPARSSGGGAHASKARTPQAAKTTFSIFGRGAGAAGAGATATPRTPQQQQQRSPVITPAAPVSFAPIPSSAAASAASTSPMTPSREYPNRQLHFTTPEQQPLPSSHAPLQFQQQLEPMSPLMPLPALGFGSVHAKAERFQPMQLSEVSEGKEELSLSPPEQQQHMEAAQTAKIETMAHAQPAMAPAPLPVALPVLSDPLALEQPSPIPLHSPEGGAACAAAGSFFSQEDAFLQHLRAKPEQQKPLNPAAVPMQSVELIPNTVPMIAVAAAVAAAAIPAQPVAMMDDSVAQSRKRRMPATPPPAEAASPPPRPAAFAAAAAASVAAAVSPSSALQHSTRTAESFLTPGRAPVHHALLAPPTPQVFTSPLSAPSSSGHSSSSNSSGVHTLSLAQRRPPSITPAQPPVLRATTPDAGDYDEEPEYDDDAEAEADWENEAQVTKEIIDVTTGAAAGGAAHSTKRKQRASGGGESGGKAGKKKRKSSESGVTAAAAAAAAVASSSTDFVAPPASVLATSNPHAALARRLKSRAKNSGTGGTASSGSTYRGVARGCWTHTAEGLKIYICRADGLQYTGSEAMRRAQEDERAAQTRKGLTAVAAPSPSQAIGAASASQIDLTTLQSPSSRSPSAAPAAAAAPAPIAPLHSLSDWHIPQCIVDAYAEAGLTSLYDWQVDCLSLPGVLEGSSNIVYSASTSAGKTLVAEILIITRMLNMAPSAQAATEALHAATGAAGRASLSCNRKVLFVLPYVATVDEKVRDLVQKLSRAGFAIKPYHGQQSSAAQIEAGFTVCAAPGAAPNPITGAVSFSSRDMNRLGEEIDIGVVVIEKANVLLSALKRENRMGELAAVVVDELHMISSGGGPGIDELSQPSASTAASAAAISGKRSNPQSFAQNRGYHIELFLAKIQEWNSRHCAPASASSAVAPALPIQIIGLSATLPNMDLFAQWLSPCALYSTEFRPVPLKESILCRGILYVKRENPEWIAEMERQRQAVREGQPQPQPQPPVPARLPPRFVFEEEQRLAPSLISKQTKQNQAELEKLSQASAASTSRGGNGGGGSSANTRTRPPTAEEIAERELMVDLIESTILPGTCLGGSGSGLVAAGNNNGHGNGGGGGVLVFCSSKGHVETMAGAIARSLRRRAQVREFGYIQTKARGTTSKQKTLDSFVAAASTSPLKHGGLPDPEMQQRRQMLLQRLAGASECADDCLRRTVPHGVGFHHAGLTGDERQLIEGAFRAGTLSVICCTSTLAAGVNLPARRVLFHGIRVAQSLISLTQYQQMSGRAGRKGMQEEGSSIVLAHNERDLEHIKCIMNQALPQLKSALDMDSATAGNCEDMIPAAANSAASAAASSTIAPPSAPPTAANPYLSHGLLDCLSSSGAVSVGALACPSVGRDSLASFLGHTLLAHQKAREEAARNKKAALLAQVRSHAASSWGQQPQQQQQQHPPHSAAGGASALPPLPSTLQSEMDLCLRYLVSRSLAEGAFDITGSFVGRATDLGLAMVEAGLGPREGLRLYSELSMMRTQGFVSGSSLHLCWLLTPEPSIAYWRQMESESAHWERIYARFELMNNDPERKMDLEACKRIPFPKSIRQTQQHQQQQQQQNAQPTPQRMQPQPYQPHQPLRSAAVSNLMGPPSAPPPRFGVVPGSAVRFPAPAVSASSFGSELCISNPEGVRRLASLFHDFVSMPDRPRTDCPQLLAYLRLYHAMVLQDLLDDSLPLAVLSSRTQLTRGELQRRLTEATMLCNQLITLCERLGWRDFSLVLELYRERLAHGGAPPELLGLMRLPGLKIGRARMLHKAGFDSLEKIAAHATPEKLVEIFARNTAYRGVTVGPTTPMRAGAAAAAADAAAPPPSQAARAKRSILQQQEAVQICHDARQIVQQQQQ